jgi:ankyrin repeat protein
MLYNSDYSSVESSELFESEKNLLLCWACYNGLEEQAKWLIMKNANRTYFENGPLYNAIEGGGHTAIVKLLLQFDDVRSKVTAYGHRCLAEAQRQEYDDIVEILEKYYL